MKFFPLLFTILLFAGGCAATCPTEAPETAIPVEIRPTAAVTVVQAQAVRQADRVLVRGSLKRPHTVALPGHVDVLFLGADGASLGEHRLKVARIDSKRGDIQEIPFSGEFALSLPEGARAVLSYHSPPFEGI